jgi:hypothetical protein
MCFKKAGEKGKKHESVFAKAGLLLSNGISCFKQRALITSTEERKRGEREISFLAKQDTKRFRNSARLLVASSQKRLNERKRNLLGA